MTRVDVDARARRAWPWLPPRAPVGAVLVGPCGEVLRVADDGAIDEVLAPGHPRGGAASDPVNARGK